MALSFASNVDSIRIQTDLTKTTQSLSKTFQRLSSGLRINEPADDPSGFALAEELNNDARVATVAIRNANDGLSIATVADAGLQEIGNILSRMAELANQSANGTYTNSQRSALSSEFLALGSEIERIASTTVFNTSNLLSNSGAITVQVGLDGSANSRFTLTSVLGTLNSLGLSGNNSGALTFSIITASSTGSIDASNRALSAIQAAMTSVTSRRGDLGAQESRLSSAISYLTVMRENFVAAESKIRDADIAQEVAEMVRLQILQQAETAVLASANQQPGVALSLLQ